MRSIIDIPEYDKNYAKDNGKCEDKNIIQLAAVRGHVYTGKNSSRSIIYEDDFFTTSIDFEKMYGIRSNNSNTINNFIFSTGEEATNFLNYVNSFAARFFLSLVKTDVSLHRGQLAYVPAVDFTRSWTDIELYEHFGFSDELVEYLEGFLGDYYGRCS